MRAVAAAENLSLRRVQKIVREQLDRPEANPADDFALLQIVRVEPGARSKQRFVGWPTECGCAASLGLRRRSG